MQKIILIGAGGYAKSVLDSLDKDRYICCGFIDNFKPIGSYHLGLPILANTVHDFSEREQYGFFVSIGDNIHRQEKFVQLQQTNCQIINVVDKSAIVSENAVLGVGVFVGKMAVVNAGVTIGNNVIINTKALIEHGCSVNHHCNISTNAVVNGDVQIDEGAFIGSSSVIIGQLAIGKYAIVGAGAVVTRSVVAHSVVVGCPAKPINTKTKKEYLNEQ